MAEYGFYDFDNTTGDINAVDKGLQQLESAAAPILKRLETPGTELSHQDIALLAFFLSTMYLRVPRTLKAIEEFREIAAFETLKYSIERPSFRQRVLEDAKRFNGRLGTDEEIVQLFHEADKHLRVVPDHQDSVAESVKFITPIAELLYLRMSWTICRAPNDSFFISSDMPLCVILPTGVNSAILGAGFGQKEVEITFPVSPRVLLLIDWKRRQRHMTVSEAFVREKNKHMALIAERWVIGHVESRTIKALVQNCATTRDLPKLDRRIAGRLFASKLHERGSVSAPSRTRPE